VFIFNLSNISASLALLAQELGFPTCYYFANNWFITIEKDPWFQLWPKENKGFRILRFLTRRFMLLPPIRPLNIDYSVFSNSYLKNVTLQLERTPHQPAVIPWGIDTDRFPFQEAKNQKPSRLLCVGQIKPHKGFDHAIKTLKFLNRESKHHSYTLTIAGNGDSSPGYTAYLRNIAQMLGVQNSLSFHPLTMREDMSDLYHGHDIFLSPSTCETSLNLSLLEAMSCGIPIVSTSTAGNSDTLKNEFNALIFDKENPQSCTEQIQRLSENPDLRESIRKNGRDTIQKYFRVDQTAQAIERAMEDSIRWRTKEHLPQTHEQLPVSMETMHDEPLTNLISQTKRWLKFGNLVVFIRKLLRPQIFVYVFRKIFEKTLSYSMLLFLPAFLEVFFRLTGRHRKISDIDPDTIRNVLVIQPADIGDVILTSPFLRELRRFLPKARIMFVVQPKMFNLVENCPYVNEVITYDYRAAKNWKSFYHGSFRWWLQSARIAKRYLWKYRPDLAISTRWNNDPCQAASIILMYMSGAPVRLGYQDVLQDQKRRSMKDINHLITHGPVRSFARHEIELQFDILRLLGACPKERSLEVWTTQKDEIFARNLLDRINKSDRDLLIALGPGASWSFRRWPPSRFIELGNWLQENYKAHILIYGGKDELELALHIERGLHKTQTVNLAGKTTLREMASLLKHCKLFIGNDSGPLHVAAASGVPVIDFFGPADYNRFRPWGAQHEVLCLGLSCSPCPERCLFDEPRCIKGISVNHVKKIAAEKLTSLLAHS
jgi:heptosyltransferase-2